jgi:hypothetical protein
MTDEYDEDLFQDYLTERALKFGPKINTKRSVDMIRTKLVKFHNTGFDTAAIIKHGIEVGWRSLFVPAGMEPKQKHLTAPGPILDQAKELAKAKEIPGPTDYGKKAAKALQQVLRE